ncbi:putative solute-binding protein [Thalassolituus oleivorans]|uniref:putative solute-binding protein n=1 Tax=Thalassolituus oleivorans TaxID=187493 RepID=UPI0030C8D0E1
MRKLLCVAALAASQLTFAAADERKFCIYDPLGANGNLYGLMKEYREFAIQQNVNIHLRAYTDEKIASDDFKAEQCDAVMLTGARARPYSKFASTIEAIGAVPTTSVMRSLVNTISQPGAAKYMVTGDRYEVGGVIPAGPIYLFLRDRSVDTVEEMSGKRIATLEYDEPSVKMVNHVGASIVPSNSANFSGKFNNGSVDIAYAPAIAYSPLEMYKGIGTKGGILRYNLAYLDFQVLLHKERFPEGYGQKSRLYVAGLFDKANAFVTQDTAGIPETTWIDLPKADVEKYNEMLRQVRITLRDEGVYDATMLTLLRKLRCRENPAEGECVENLE